MFKSEIFKKNMQMSAAELLITGLHAQHTQPVFTFRFNSHDLL